MTLSDGAEAAEGLALDIEARGQTCTQGGTLAVRGGDGAGFAASFSVIGGSLDALVISSHGAGYTFEDGLQVVIDSGGVGCQGLVLRPRLRSLRLNPNATSVVIRKVGKQALEVAQGADGPTYDFSVQVASAAASATSDAAILQGVALLAPPSRLSSFAVVAGSVTTRGLSIAWAPGAPLRLSLSLDGGVTFFNHAGSPLSANLTQQDVSSYVNALGVEEGLAAGARLTLRACPFDASRAAGEQQRADGCSLLRASLASPLAGVTRLEARHVNSTSVSIEWDAPLHAPPAVPLVYAIEVAVVNSLAPTPYSPRFFRLGGAWEDLSARSTSFSLQDLVDAAVFDLSLPESSPATSPPVSSSTSAAPAGTTAVSTTPSPPPPSDPLDQRVAALSRALGARARILGTLCCAALCYAT